MPPSARLPHLLALALCAFLFGAAVYRATALSVTVDEAYTYTQFVMRPLSVAMTDYDANNHVFYTLLARLTTSVFGAGDLTLRLPALGAAALFYFALFRLLVRLTGTRPWLLPLGVAAIGANTYITDLLPLARGYGLALAFFTLALSFLVDAAPSLRTAGICLGLSVAANLTFLFPATGLMAGVVWLERRASLGATVCSVATAAVLLAVPLWHAKAEHYYFGTDSLETSAGTLLGVSLARSWSDRSGPVPAAMAIMAATLGAAVVAGAILRRRARPLFLLATAIGLGLSALAASHYAAHLPYPFGRTGIVWLLLFGLSLIALAARFRPVAVAATPVLLAALYFYLRTWSTQLTTEWEWDAGTRAIAERIAAQPRAAGGDPVRIGASPMMAHTLNYYRHTRGWTWMEDVKAAGNPRQGNYDYYVLTNGEDRDWAAQQGMTVLYEHPAAHSILARRRP